MYDCHPPPTCILGVFQGQASTKYLPATPGLPIRLSDDFTSLVLGAAYDNDANPVPFTLLNINLSGSSENSYLDSQNFLLVVASF